MRGVNLLLVVVITFAFVNISFVLAEINITQQQTAENCLSESNIAIADLVNYNISQNRFNDSYNRAKTLYDAQLILISKKQKVDFTSIISTCDQIKKLKSTAIEAYDSFDVLLIFYNETVDKNMDTTSIDAIINQIYEEFAGERYEGIAALIETGYSEITRVKSEQTALSLVYKATTRKFSDFFKENWIPMVVVLILLIIFYFAYKTKISKWMLQRKLESLMLRRDTLKKLIGDTQKEYFQTGKLSERDYIIRTKNFADMIRDIDRQVSIVQKDLARYTMRIDFLQKEREDLKRRKR